MREERGVVIWSLSLSRVVVWPCLHELPSEPVRNPPMRRVWRVSQSISNTTSTRTHLTHTHIPAQVCKPVTCTSRGLLLLSRGGGRLRLLGLVDEGGTGDSLAAVSIGDDCGDVWAAEGVIAAKKGVAGGRRLLLDKTYIVGHPTWRVTFSFAKWASPSSVAFQWHFAVPVAAGAGASPRPGKESEAQGDGGQR